LFPEERALTVCETWAKPVTSILRITNNKQVLINIKRGYREDKFCMNLMRSKESKPNLKDINELWYIGSRLLILQVGNIRENLFRLAHDIHGHFGADKTYGSLRDNYYWPNMRRDLEKAYIPSAKGINR
jgi:hypothetical protein